LPELSVGYHLFEDGVEDVDPAEPKECCWSLLGAGWRRTAVKALLDHSHAGWGIMPDDEYAVSTMQRGRAISRTTPRA
jgi:hypothetical protein